MNLFVTGHIFEQYELILDHFERLGLCLNLNLGLSKTLKYVPVDEEDKPLMELVLSDNDQTIWSFLHTGNDLPDAITFHPLLIVPNPGVNPKTYSLQVSKRISTR